LNGDGKPDAVTVDPDAAFATVMLGNGDGTFQILNGYETDGTSPFSAPWEISMATGKPTWQLPTRVR